MADTGQERTEQPTDHKLRQARKRGEVALSRDFSSSLALAAGTGALVYSFTSLCAQAAALARTSFDLAVSGDLTSAALLTGLIAGLEQMIPMIAGVSLAVLAVSALAPLAQIGPLLTFEPMKPKIEKLNPVSGLKRIFFSLPPYVELLKNLLKVSVAGLLCWQVVRAELSNIALVGRQPPLAVLLLTGRIVEACLWRVILFFVGLSILDVLYQRWQFRKNQRMTRKEVMDEFKQMEGDPQHKAARHRLHEEIATGSMLQSVRDADVIVTNPDHIAAALRFDPNEEDAPRLLGKGVGHLAERIKQIAREEDIPIVRNIPLARALHQLQVSDVIPEDLYEAVREVLKWVETLARSKGQLPRWANEQKQD